MDVYLPILTVEYPDGTIRDEIGFALRTDFPSKNEAIVYFADRWPQFMEGYHHKNCDLLSLRVGHFTETQD